MVQGIPSEHAPWVKQERGPLSFCPRSWCRVFIMGSISFRGWCLRSETTVVGSPWALAVQSRPSARSAAISRGPLYVLWKGIPVIAAFLSVPCVFPLTTEHSWEPRYVFRTSRPRGSSRASPTKGQLQEGRRGRAAEGVVPQHFASQHGARPD